MTAGEAALEGFLRWADRPLVKFAEWGLVLLLAAHLGGGLRLMMLEFLSWRGWHNSLLAGAAAIAIAAGMAFALSL